MIQIKKDDLLKVFSKIEWNSFTKFSDSSIPFEKGFELGNQNSWCYEQIYYKNGIVKVGAFFIIPFLIQGLKLESTILKDYIYTELNTILNWDSQETCSFTINKSPFIHYLPSNSMHAIQMPVRAACRFAIIQEFSYFASKMLKCSSKNAIDILVCFDELPLFIIENLINAYKKNSDLDFRKYLSNEIEFFNQTNEIYTKELLQKKLQLPDGQGVQKK